MPVRAIVTVIEGTTSSLSFVRDTLFPYSKKRLPAFIETRGDEPEVRHWLQEAAKEAGYIHVNKADIVRILTEWINEDYKATPLKAIQGMIWEAGYKNGDFKAHVYPDAVLKLREWHEREMPLYVYSSGSVQAQNLFFAHTTAGDLRELFSGYFDTTTGGKREWPSYCRIAEAIEVPPTMVLFLSDIVEELDAAADCGYRTYLLRRPPGPGEPEVYDDDSSRHPIVMDFGEIPV
jgi:enolase-phosphatase E1